MRRSTPAAAAMSAMLADGSPASRRAPVLTTSSRVRVASALTLSIYLFVQHIDVYLSQNLKDVSITATVMRQLGQIGPSLPGSGGRRSPWAASSSDGGRPMSRTWLSSGASRGFGRHLAEAVLEFGDDLVATARRPEQLDDLVARYGERIRSVALDATDAAEASSAVKEAVNAFGRLDVVVNNAGYPNSAPFEKMAEYDFRAQIETALFGIPHGTMPPAPLQRSLPSGDSVRFS